MLVTGAMRMVSATPDELVHREDVEAPLLTPGDHQATGQTVTKLGGQEETALVVESGGVRTKEHNALPPHSMTRFGSLTTY